MLKVFEILKLSGDFEFIIWVIYVHEKYLLRLNVPQKK